MADLGEYIFSVAATALICGIVNGILKDCSAGKLTRMICGLVLMLSVLRPIMKWNAENLSEAVFPQLSDGSRFVSQGELTAQNTIADIIKQETEAYIVDKAAAMGLAVSVQVTVSSNHPPVPVFVEITGSASPYMKLRLEEMIQEDLNISKENQVWTG